jgi:hypothetical protein
MRARSASTGFEQGVQPRGVDDRRPSRERLAQEDVTNLAVTVLGAVGQDIELVMNGCGGLVALLQRLEVEYIDNTDLGIQPVIATVVNNIRTCFIRSPLIAASQESRNVRIVDLSTRRE